MRTRVLVAAIVLSALAIVWHAQVSAQAPNRLPSAAGNQLIYIGTYAGTIQIFDEATEKRIGDIKLTTGVPGDLLLSYDRKKFYVLDMSMEKIEIVDIATRASLGSFTLSEPGTKVRIRSYQVDPLDRFLVILARGASKRSDHWEIGVNTLHLYDLAAKRVTRTIPWPDGEEQEFATIQFSPDGKFMYLFGDDVQVLDTTEFKQVETWELSRPLEPGLGRLDLGPTDDVNEEPGFFTGLFTMQDPVQNRRLMGVGRVDLANRRVDFTPIGPAQNVGFALAPGRKRAYGLQQQIGRYEFWTFDLEQGKATARAEFAGRPRMALRVSSNGRLLYVYQAGATIDVYDASTFKLLRTIEMNADQTTDLIVLPKPGRPAAAPLH